MSSLCFFRAAAFAVVLGGGVEWGRAAEPPTPACYYDEAGLRHLSLQSLGGGQVEIRVRWSSSPGANGIWLGQGTRREGQLVFAALVEEGQDRGSYFVAKGESKLEIQFRPGQKMPQDPGVLGVYRHISEEKRLQLVRKESQAAEDRLAAALKNGSRTWPTEDRSAAGDWKSRWPALRDRWMKIAYQPASPANVKPGVPSPTVKGRPAAEGDVAYWLKLAEAAFLGYSFLEPLPESRSQGSWDGEYYDGFGGGVSIRKTSDGRLRVSLTCTRVSELHGADVQGNVPAEAVKAAKAGEAATAEAVFIEAELPENARDVRVRLKRKGGFLWVETERKQAPPGRLSWFDGIYRWSPVPAEQ